MPGGRAETHYDADLLARASAADRCSPRPMEPIPRPPPNLWASAGYPLFRGRRATPQGLLASCRCQAHETIELNLDGVVLLDARGVATAPCVTTLSPRSMAGRRMIVRKEPDGSLILIAQTNHAELSGFFAANWGNEMFARPRPHQSVVRAAIYHDAGWYKYEA